MTRVGMAAMVAGCLFLGACSGGNQGPSVSSDLARRANSLCGDWTTALNQLGASPPLADANRMVPFTKDQVSIDRDYTARFKALSATKSEQSALAPVYAGFDAVNNAEAGVLSAAQAGDRPGIQTFHEEATNETTKTNLVLNALGLKVCAS